MKAKICIFLSLLACIASCEKSKQTKTQAAEEKTAPEYAAATDIKPLPAKLSVRGLHVAGIRPDGTVIVFREKTKVNDSIVVTIMSNEHDRVCKASDLNNVISISNGDVHIVGLKKDGTVVAAGSNEFHQCDVSDWNGIVAISAGSLHTVGLKSDSTVVTVGDNMYGERNVSDWNDIVAISAGYNHTVGLKSDGTVVATGDNYDGQRNVSDWNNIIAISAGTRHTVGLKSDGTVVAAGGNKYYNQRNVSDWNNVIAISAMKYHTLGLKSDGTIVKTVSNNEKVPREKATIWDLPIYCTCHDSLIACGGENIVDWSNFATLEGSVDAAWGLKSDGSIMVMGYGSKTDSVAVRAACSLGVALYGGSKAKEEEANNIGECNFKIYEDAGTECSCTDGDEDDEEVIEDSSTEISDEKDTIQPE